MTISNTANNLWKMKDKEEYLRSINIIKNGVLQKNRDIVVW